MHLVPDLTFFSTVYIPRPTLLSNLHVDTVYTLGNPSKKAVTCAAGLAPTNLPIAFPPLNATTVGRLETLYCIARAC